MQHVHCVGELLKRHEMELHVLARGEVAFAAAAEIADIGKALELSGCQHAAGHLGPHHLNARLALSVAAKTEAVRAEIVFGNAAGENVDRFGAELFDLRADCVIVLVLKFACQRHVNQCCVGVIHGETPYSL